MERQIAKRLIAVICLLILSFFALAYIMATKKTGANEQLIEQKEYGDGLTVAGKIITSTPQSSSFIIEGRNSRQLLVQYDNNTRMVGTSNADAPKEILLSKDALSVGVAVSIITAQPIVATGDETIYAKEILVF